MWSDAAGAVWRDHLSEANTEARIRRKTISKSLNSSSLKAYEDRGRSEDVWKHLGVSDRTLPNLAMFGLEMLLCCYTCRNLLQEFCQNWHLGKKTPKLDKADIRIRTPKLARIGQNRAKVGATGKHRPGLDHSDIDRRLLRSSMNLTPDLTPPSDAHSSKATHVRPQAAAGEARGKATVLTWSRLSPSPPRHTKCSACCPSAQPSPGWCPVPEEAAPAVRATRARAAV